MTDYGTLFFNIGFGIWKDILGIVEIHFIDTYKTTYVSFYGKRKTFTVNKKEYAVDVSKVKNGKVYYHSLCGEGVKIGLPTIMELNYSKTSYWVDSSEYFSKMHNTVIDKLMISAEKEMIKNIFYVTIFIALVVCFIGYKIMNPSVV